MNSKAKFLHFLFWLIHLVVTYTSLPARVTLSDKLIITLIVVLSHALITYLTINFLWARTINRDKPYIYLFGCVLSACLTAFVIFFPVNYFFSHYSILFFTVFDIATFLLYAGASILTLFVLTCIKMFDRLSIYKYLGLNRDNAQLAELDAISARANEPLILDHINSILEDASGKEVDAIASMRRHMKMVDYLYSDTSELQLITKEIQFLMDFNELNISKNPELKYRINFDYDGTLEVKRVIPLILFPFYEKAMHYIEVNVGKSQIKTLVYGENNFIRFQIFAEFPEIKNHDVAKIKELETRIISAKRRLMEYYPDEHELIINENKTHYNVFLRINVE